MSGAVIRNPPSNAGDVGSFPGPGTKIPHATGQLSPTTREKPASCKERDHVLQLRPTAKQIFFKKERKYSADHVGTDTTHVTILYKMLSLKCTLSKKS